MAEGLHFVPLYGTVAPWRKWVSLAVFLTATCVYLNTLPAGFLFDDNFALITNSDVSDPNTAPWTLWTHDFWGQNIRSPMSHKSYRPLTVLSFRCIHMVWCMLPAEWRAWTPWATKAHEGGKGFHPSVPLDPLPFHVVNMLLHGVVSVLFYMLAYRWFERKEAAVVLDQLRDLRRQGVAPASAGSKPGVNGKGVDAGVAEAPAKVKKPRSVRAAAEALTAEPADAVLLEVEAEGRIRVELQAAFAAFCFSLHPIHTEAVAGIVGHAELLSAFFSLLALLIYCMAADGRYPAFNSWLDSRLDGNTLAALDAAKQKEQQWYLGLLGASLMCVWAAGLSKEIGITVVGAMIVYELYVDTALRGPVTELEYWLQWQAQQDPAQKQQQKQQKQGQGQEQGQELQELAEEQEGGTAGYRTAAADLRHLQERRAVRVVALVATVGMFVLVRGWLVGDQLVRIYRKVENPIPFLEPRLARALTTLHLHARYFQLLLWPHPLSADWSYNCIPPLTTLSDPRNLLALLTHGGCLYCLVVAQPLRPLRTLLACFDLPSLRSTPLGRLLGTAGSVPGQKEVATPEEGPHVMYTRWRLLPLFGLMVGPFLPASNVFFYVGTFIGERLLYVPSLGLCLLLADMLGWWLLDLSPAGGPGLAAVATQLLERGGAVLWNVTDKGRMALLPGKVNLGRQRGGGLGFAHYLQMLGVLLSCLLLLSTFALSTWSRNLDWRDEAALFRAADKVCPDSTKVKLNMGILLRREGDYRGALAHFRRARAIEPTFCEPTYWEGITLLALNQPDQAADALVEALGCKYVALDAIKALAAILRALDEQSPAHADAHVRWGRALLQPAVGRMVEGCNALEKGALLHALEHRNLSAALHAVDTCISSLRTYRPPVGAQHVDFPLDPPQLSDTTIQGALACAKARQHVYTTLAKRGPTAKPLKRHIYKYLAHSAASCRAALRDQRPLALGPGNPALSAHMLLIHKVQAADAEDPWLQGEWGETLVEEDGRVAEGLLHLQVSAAMLLGDSRQPTPKTQSLEGDGPVTPLRAVKGAVRVLKRAVELAPRTAEACQIRTTLCTALHRLSEVVQDRTKDAARQQALQCISDLRHLSECASLLQSSQ